MQTADLLAKLEVDRPPCPVCQDRVIPSKGPVKILTFGVGDDATHVALMPVHQKCVGEAQEKIRKGIDDVKRRQASGLWLPGPFIGELRSLD